MAMASMAAERKGERLGMREEVRLVMAMKAVRMFESEVDMEEGRLRVWEVR